MSVPAVEDGGMPPISCSRPLLAIVALMWGMPALATRCESIVRDPARGRSIAVAVTLPGTGADLPVVIWSPGLGGGLAQGRRYAETWAAAGIATVQIEHPGSDAAVYREAAVLAKAAADPASAERARAARIRAGSDGRQLVARLGDAALVHARLAEGQTLGACITTRINAVRAGIAGHSMGAWVAQIMAGQALPGLTMGMAPVFSAALAMSGSALAPGAELPTSAAGIAMPFMLITGSLDGAPANADADTREATVKQRTALWPHLPAGEKYLLVLDSATHMQFDGTARNLKAGIAGRLLHATTDFWRATLADDAAAAARLKNFKPAGGDVFEMR
jgi:predicted dienelactone hydrolase